MHLHIHSKLLDMYYMNKNLLQVRESPIINEWRIYNNINYVVYDNTKQQVGDFVLLVKFSLHLSQTRFG